MMMLSASCTALNWDFDSAPSTYDENQQSVILFMKSTLRAIVKRASWRGRIIVLPLKSDVNMSFMFVHVGMWLIV